MPPPISTPVLTQSDSCAEELWGRFCAPSNFLFHFLCSSLLPFSRPAFLLMLLSILISNQILLVSTRWTVKKWLVNVHINPRHQEPKNELLTPFRRVHDVDDVMNLRPRGPRTEKKPRFTKHNVRGGLFGFAKAPFQWILVFFWTLVRLQKHRHFYVPGSSQRTSSLTAPPHPTLPPNSAARDLACRLVPSPPPPTSLPNPVLNSGC